MIICQGSLNMLVLRPGSLSYLIQAGLPVFRVDLQIVKCYRYYHMVQESWANNECGFNCFFMYEGKPKFLRTNINAKRTLLFL